MTPFHVNFFPILLVGCLIGAISSLVAGRLSGCLLPGVLLVIGVLAVWTSLFIGSDMGYRAWQGMPDPPEEAFSDASVLGALVFGWFPGIVFCSICFGIARGMRAAMHWANPDAVPNAPQSNTQPVETGNPYQHPGSR